MVEILDLVLPATAYLTAVYWVRRRGGGWPAWRTAAFAAALVAAVLVTGGWVDARARDSLAWHMTQQMTLLVAVPPALLAGRPVALFRAATGSAAGRRLLPNPAAAWLVFVAIQWVVHIPAVLDRLVREPALNGLVHWLFVAAGLAFFVQAAPWAGSRLPPLVLALYLASAMPTTDGIAIWLMLDPHVIYSSFAGPGALADQRAAGFVMFAAGNVMLVAAAWVAGRWLWRGWSSDVGGAPAGLSRR
jgi:cytochrome c oxidase assembly factor CtaG